MTNEDNHRESEAKTINMQTLQDWIRERGLLSKTPTALDYRTVFAQMNLNDVLNG